MPTGLTHAIRLIRAAAAEREAAQERKRQADLDALDKANLARDQDHSELERPRRQTRG